MGSMKGKTKQSALQRLAVTRQFLDGFDDYVVEFERWKTMEVVRGLLGVFELEDDDYRERETQELLGQFGFGSCTQLFYNVELDNTVGLKRDSSTLGGWTSAVRDQHGRVRPVVFLQKNVPPQLDATEEGSDQTDACHKLLVLMHEMGHADDIRKSVNYNHQTLELDILSAEVYAHDFVVRKCRKLGYRFVLQVYLDSIEEHLQSENEVARLAAERFLNSQNLRELREFTEITQGVIRASLEKSGRMKEFLKRYPGEQK